jgi:hypothetical protein
MPNLQEEARKVAHNVLMEMNGTKDFSDPTTPTTNTPDTPTPTNPSRRVSPGPTKLPTIETRELSSPTSPLRPAAPPRNNSHSKNKNQNNSRSSDLQDDDLSHQSVPGQLKAGFEAEEKEMRDKDKERSKAREGNLRRKPPGKMENESLFLKTESTGVTEQRSHSVVGVRDSEKEKEKDILGDGSGSGGAIIDVIKTRRKGK